MVQEPNGVLIVNKHAGVTSHHIVGVVRRLYNTRRVGHAGTLDPMATGVLVVLTLGMQSMQALDVALAKVKHEMESEKEEDGAQNGADENEEIKIVEITDEV